MKKIAFGTSGWRGIIADTFTFPRLRLVSKAVAGHLKAAGLASKGVAVAYDPRFLSEHFAAEAARSLEAEGIPVTLSTSHVPTPAVAHLVRVRSLGGAINITASHNPAAYSGFKFNNHRGAPAPPEATKDLESRIDALVADPGEEYFAREPVDVHRAHSEGHAGADATDPVFREPYFEQLAKIVRFEEIRKSGITIAVDPLWGAGRGFFPEILRRHGIPILLLHDDRDVTFGGLGPDVAERNMAELRSAVASRKARIGIATDGDADRFGVVDADGTVVSANTILALLADYLAGTRGWRHGLARTYATTRLIDAVAAHHGMPIHQTPVGFKYLGEMILEGKVYLAGEESAGMSVLGHVPEKDGLLAGLLAAEMVAAKGKTLAELREELFRKVGAFHSAREDTPVTPEQMSRVREKMSRPPDKVGARPVSGVTIIDGIRLDFEDGAWILMRPSGTEPVVRYYAEARTPADLVKLIEDGRKALLS